MVMQNFAVFVIIEIDTYLRLSIGGSNFVFFLFSFFYLLDDGVVHACMHDE
jgi:hypothetical protein